MTREEQEKAALAASRTGYKRRDHQAEVLPAQHGAVLDALSMVLSRKSEPRFENTPEGLQRFKETAAEFLDFCRIRSEEAARDGTQGIVPSVSAWCAFMGISRQTLSKYSRRSPEWTESIETIKERIFCAQEQAAFCGKVPVAVHVFNAVNNHSMADVRQVSVHTEEPERERMSASEIRKQIGLISEEDRENEQL